MTQETPGVTYSKAGLPRPLHPGVTESMHVFISTDFLVASFSEIKVHSKMSLNSLVLEFYEQDFSLI